MAFRTTLVPFLGGAVALGFAALAIARRGARGQLVQSDRGPRFELDPIGPSEDVDAVLDPEHPLTPRTEAEALAGLSTAWPLKPPSPAGDAPIHASVPDRGEVAGRQRHEVSSLVGAHAIAPDAIAIGEELVDPGAVEVPVGHSADADFDFRLGKDKLVQPETTGGVLQEPGARAGFSQVAANDLDDLDIDFDDIDDEELTVDIVEHPQLAAEAYDAVLPEDLGTEWLARATEAPSTVALQPIDDIAEIPSDDAPAMSEGSELAAQALDDDEPRTRSPLADEEVEVPGDLWDAFEKTRR